MELIMLLITLPVFCTSKENIDCFNREVDPKGFLYRGFKSSTMNGRICQKWTSQSPNNHGRTPQSFPNAGLGDHNYCRNPDGEPGGPWCYNSHGTSPRWEYCGIPYCDASTAGMEA
ncbi:hypothetical protein ACHWQZ_G004848 [Mnemiopsis leidyi]